MTDPTAVDSPEPAAGERSIDLDAARKARREKQGPAPTITFLEQTYPLPRNMPAKVLDLIGEVGGGDYTASVTAFKILLGGEVYDKIAEAAEAAGDPLEIDDVIFLLTKALEVYEITLPESEASSS